jgi:RNA-splicing ligase RtcB
MIEIEGKYNKAVVYTDELEENSRKQIKELCSQAFTEGSTIRMMPDVHAGMGCTIGTTMTITDKIVPNLVGVDIGCGMETIVLKTGSYTQKRFNPETLDKIIRNEIPCGRNIRNTPHELSEQIDLTKLRCQKRYQKINIHRALQSIGSLGGGNHFIEVDKDDEDRLYIVIHSGSRHLGTEIASYYQEEAFKRLNQINDEDIKKAIESLKAQEKENEIPMMINKIRSTKNIDIPKSLAYVEGGLFDDYINDMKITQLFAELNRKAMADVILKGLGIKKIEDQFTTIHNYIDTEHMILRKGAVSALVGQKLLIPLNMRDGSLICIGLGNPDWNYSAPHGAGRLMSRKDARESLDMREYKKSMEGIFSSCVNVDTIDESPMAYKPMEDIIKQITPTAKILKVIKPIYNFKASE